MDLEEILNERKQKQLTQPTNGHTSNGSQLGDEVAELKKQNDLLRERMIEIEDSQDKRNQKIDHLLEKLEKGTEDWNSKVNRAVEKVSDDLRSSQRAAYLRIEKRFEKQSAFAEKFHKAQLVTYFTLYIIAIVLFIALIARTLAVGVWEGLFLSQLWNLGEWYWSALTVVILVGLVGGLLLLILKGIEDLR